MRKFGNKCRSILANLKKKTKKTLIIGAFGAMAFVAIPSISHHLYGEVTGHEHLGYGIHFDLDKIQSLLDDKEIYYLENPDIHWKKAAHALYEKFQGDYDDHKTLRVWPLPRKASSYMEGGVGRYTDRGLCRHKAIVVAAILNHYGIRAQLQTSWTDIESGHMWVYLPDHDYIIDTTMYRIGPMTKEIRDEMNQSLGSGWVPYDHWKLTFFELGVVQ